MGKQFQAEMVNGAGRHALAHHAGHTQHGVVLGDRWSFNWEGSVPAAAATFTFSEAVRTIRVWAAQDVYLAREATALATAGDGTNAQSRHVVKADGWVELPWFWDEVHFEAVAGAGGQLLIEGRV